MQLLAGIALIFIFYKVDGSKLFQMNLRRTGIASIVLAQCLGFAPLALLAAKAEESKPLAAVGKTEIDGEASRIFRKARQIESDGDEATALKLYEQLVQAEPSFVYGWSNLGNTLAATGSLDEALICYKKAISLRPPKEPLAVIILNKASVENALDHFEVALKDLSYAEAIDGSTQTVLSNKAVTLSKLGRWKEACDIFESIISSADRYALPWWLRYAMALLETDRGMESVAYLQRVLNRFPDEAEVKAFAAALYYNLGSPAESARYWASVPDADRVQYTKEFVENKLRWGSRAVSSYSDFLRSGPSTTVAR